MEHEQAGGSGPGTLYLRFNPDKAQSPISGGSCTDPARACTVEGSGSVGPKPATYWAATDSGSKALFTIGNEGLGDLYSYDAATQTPTQIATGVRGLLGWSDDLDSIYLVSTDVLDSGAAAGKPNLYLWRQGEGTRFIATLGPGFNDTPSWSNDPAERTARVTPDGGAVTFLSTAPLTGFDNTDAQSGEADREVFLYDAGADHLRCVSCNPSGVRPRGKAVFQRFDSWTAAQIPGASYSLHESHVLSSDGDRLFFESFEGLDPRDTNETQDVYEWLALGSGGCEEGDSSFSPEAGGCIALISSGTDPRVSKFIDASADGTDVFIRTVADLVPDDSEYIDIYDARIGGGLASQHQVATPPCEGEGCRGAGSTVPATPPPGTPSFQGPGNPAQGEGRENPGRAQGKEAEEAR